MKRNKRKATLNNSLADLKAWGSPYNNKIKNDFIDDNINDI